MAEPQKPTADQWEAFIPPAPAGPSELDPWTGHMVPTAGDEPPQVPEAQGQQPVLDQQRKGIGIAKSLPFLHFRTPTTESLNATELATRQHVSPNAQSPYFPSTQSGIGSAVAGSDPSRAPKLLGYMLPSKGGVYGEEQLGPGGVPLYFNEEQQANVAINPVYDYVAQAPDGRMAVYSRTPQTNENRFTSTARAISPFLATAPPTTGVRALTAAERAAAGSSDADIARQVRQDINATNAQEMERDLAAHRNLQVPPAGVTFSQGPMAAIGQMISRIPVLGYPIKKSLDVALVAARDAANRMGEAMQETSMVPGYGGAAERAGRALQGGIERWGNAGIADLEPGILTELGVQPRAPGERVGEVFGSGPGAIVVRDADGTLAPLDPSNVVINEAGHTVAYRATGRGLPGRSPGQIEREAEALPIRQPMTMNRMGITPAEYQAMSPAEREQVDRLAGQGIAQTSRGVPVPAARPFDTTIMGRRSAEDMSDGELRAIWSAPADQTSFAARAEALYEKAWRNLPRLFDTLGRPNYSSNAVDASNTRAALRGIESQIGNQISGQSTLDGALARRILDPHGGQFTIAELRAIRTEIGRQIGNLNPLTSTLSGQQLNRIYGALTTDMEVGVRDIANKTYINYNQLATQANRPNLTTREQTIGADQALRDFRVADRYYRQGMGRMDQFSKILGTDNPQRAAGALYNAMTEGTTGNMSLVRNALSVLRPEERNQIASFVLQQIGTPRASATGMVQAAGFSPSSAFSRLNKMSPEARTLLFGPQYSDAIGDLHRVVGRLATQEGLANTSRSGTDLINFLVMGLMEGIPAGMAVSGHAAAIGATMVGASAPALTYSVLFSRPSYVRWMVGFAKAREAAGRSPAGDPRVLMMVNQLQNMVKRDPALLPALNAVRGEHGVNQGQSDDQRQDQKPGAQPPQ